MPVTDDCFEIKGAVLERIDDLTLLLAKSTCSVITERKDFVLKGVYRIDGDYFAEILVVQCIHDGIPNKNSVGIKGREKLALVFYADEKQLPEVWALRKDFPVIIHQNATIEGAPCSLCLYSESWTHLKRYWTPQRHLERIKWWLRESAIENIHPDEQPVEQVFFQPKHEIVLPSNFHETIKDNALHFNVEPRFRAEKDFRILTGTFSSQPNFSMVCLSVILPPLVHGAIEKTPQTLGALNDQLMGRDVSFSGLMLDEIKRRVDGKGIPADSGTLSLIVLNIPVLRSREDETPARVDQFGYVIHESFTGLGTSTGVLIRQPDDELYYVDPISASGMFDTSSVDDWKDIEIEPLGIIREFDRDLANQCSGLLAPGPEKGVLAGYGALGSALHMFWSRSGWGNEWTFIDPDYLKPHNLSRHTALECQIGRYKTDIATEFSNMIFPQREQRDISISGLANDFNNEKIITGLCNANLIVDVTTTLEVPRDIANRDDVGRSCSVFLTPSGTGSVLLLEDVNRNIRLDALEAQYYRSVINNLWGEEHLSIPGGNYRTGAGCRDISNVISNENVFLQAASLSNQLRSKYELEDASIHVLHTDENDSLIVEEIIPREIHSCKRGKYELFWDEGICEKVRALRTQHFPTETGGILLGYFDNVLNKIYVVDALPSPEDSIEEETGFERGISGVEESVVQASRKTGRVVTYIGEWHSHPPGVEANPSSDDISLIVHLAIELNHDGYPALMLIVGETTENWHLCYTVGE